MERGKVLGRILFNKFGMLVLGLVLLPLGIFFMNQTEVTCGSDVMSPGDTCETTRKGRTTTNTYEEEKAEQALMGKVFTGAGAALILGGGTWIAIAAKRRKQEEEADQPPAFPVASA